MIWLLDDEENLEPVEGEDQSNASDNESNWWAILLRSLVYLDAISYAENKLAKDRNYLCH